MSTKVFDYPVVIEERYLDSFGHMNNAVYLTLFEQARWELINGRGYGPAQILATGIGPTILELKLSFLKEITLNDKILIQTELVSYKGKICKLLQKMIRNAEVCCIGEFTIGLFDLKTRKLILPTPEWLHAIGQDL
jgi:thioesterase III